MASVLLSSGARAPENAMSVLRQIVKKIALGGDSLPMRFFIEQSQPQSEITVCLKGWGPIRDVTRCHGPASTIPCTFWVAFGPGESPSERECDHLTLEFRETRGNELLGRIGLKWRQVIAAGPAEIIVFEARNAVNRCHRKIHDYAHTWLRMWKQRKSKSKIRLSSLEHVAMSVLFTCPRPISLVSVDHAGTANLFPLNVMSDAMNDYFAFALTACKLPAQILEAAGRFALSATPIEHAPTAFALAANHNRPSIKWSELPFPTRLSKTFGIPVPEFSPRIREMTIESVHRVGSHSLFVARTICEERWDAGPEFSVVHGFYQAWRIRHGLDTADSVAKDAMIRGGTLSGQNLA
jgi:flavin reductase (DIM6/NTAB) family NADH-FMN oxidoreductase RutF